jgi:hypothetical protein
MFTLLRLLPWQRLLLEQLPAIAVAWAIAESHYHWKSFSLEMLGFLATWFVIDAVLQGVLRVWRRLRAPRQGIESVEPNQRRG